MLKSVNALIPPGRRSVKRRSRARVVMVGGHVMPIFDLWACFITGFMTFVFRFVAPRSLGASHKRDVLTFNSRGVLPAFVVL